MRKSKDKEITRIGGIATPCGNTCHIILHRSWLGKRVILKDDYGRMRRQEEKAKTKAVGKFVGVGNSGAQFPQETNTTGGKE